MNKKKFLLACMGRTEKQGGMNIDEFRKSVLNIIPKEDREKVRSLPRGELEDFCHVNSSVKKRINYFLQDSPLSESQEKYCRCLLHVAKKGSTNPYAICTKSVGRVGRFSCLKYMDLDKIPKDELKSYAALKGVSSAELKRIVKKERK